MADPVERIDLRLSAEHKRLIERAAAARGHSSVSGFAAVELLRAARAALEEEQGLELSTRDWERFMDILDQVEPTEALSDAARDYLAKRAR